VLVVPMSSIDVAVGVQLRSEGQPWLLAPDQEIQSHGEVFQSESSLDCQVSSSSVPVATRQKPAAGDHTSNTV